MADIETLHSCIAFIHRIHTAMALTEQMIADVMKALFGVALGAWVLLASHPRTRKEVRAKKKRNHVALPPIEEDFEIDPNLIQVTITYERHTKVMLIALTPSLIRSLHPSTFSTFARSFFLAVETLTLCEPKILCSPSNKSNGLS